MAVQLLSYERFGLENLKIEREGQLQSTTKANISSLKQKGVLFEPSDSEKLFTIDENKLAHSRHWILMQLERIQARRLISMG